MACKYHAGMLRHSITVEQRGLTPDGGGGQDIAWSTYLTARALVDPLSGGEQLHAHALKARVSHKIVARYRAGITADMRVKFGARYFNIRFVRNVEERNRWIEIYADEGVAQ